MNRQKKETSFSSLKKLSPKTNSAERESKNGEASISGQRMGVTSTSPDNSLQCPGSPLLPSDSLLRNESFPRVFRLDVAKQKLP